MQMVIAKAARDHLGKPHQHCFERICIGRVYRKGVLMTDGFRVVALSDLAVKPATGVSAARLPGER